MLSDMIEHHMTEEEAVSRIGSPKAAAREILSAAAPEQFRKKDPVLIILVLASVLLAAASLYSLCERTIRLSVSLDSSVAIIRRRGWPHQYLSRRTDRTADSFIRDHDSSHRRICHLLYSTAKEKVKTPMQAYPLGSLLAGI